MDMFGPTSLRRNDLTLLARSNVIERLAEEQEDLPEDEQIIAFGDSAYLLLSHLRSYYKLKYLKNHLNAEQLQAFKTWNYKMKTVRISIEWNYGVTASLFKYTQNLDKLKLLKSDFVQKVYVVATLFRNLHHALYGGETSNYFNVRLPRDFINHYINQTDF
jgi:hypothetical protein